NVPIAIAHAKEPYSDGALILPKLLGNVSEAHALIFSKERVFEMVELSLLAVGQIFRPQALHDLFQHLHGPAALEKFLRGHLINRFQSVVILRVLIVEREQGLATTA